MIYKSLNQQKFIIDDYSIIPIRIEDRYLIMNWRNEQVYHLRQNKLLTKKDQDLYFKNVVHAQFENDKPTQILFSFLNKNICVGYGGLVHINWYDKNAEISFIINTKLENEFFVTYWLIYLDLIQKVAFDELNLHKIFTYAFDLRPQLYNILTNAAFCEEARLKEHCFFENKYIDVVIHSKINNGVKF